MLMDDYEQLKIFLESQGYYHVRKLEDGRVICLYNFMFTTGIILDPTFTGYNGRYCYPEQLDAIEAIKKWDGTGDPSGNWVAKK